MAVFSTACVPMSGAKVCGPRRRKDAVFYLGSYSYSRSESDYNAYLEALQVISGDKNARLALLESPPNYEEARKGFLQGQNHPDDIESMIGFFLTFQRISYMRDAISTWQSADQVIDELKQLSEQIRIELNAAKLKHRKNNRIAAALAATQ